MNATVRGKTGHLHRVETDPESHSYCGRALRSGAHFTDPNEPPRVCKRCATGAERLQGVDHHHLRYADGRWVVSVPVRPPMYAPGNGYTMATTGRWCGIDECGRWVPATAPGTWTIQSSWVYSSTGNTIRVDWDWRAA